MPVEIRLLGPKDTNLVLHAALGVFDNLPKTSLTTEFLNDSRHHLMGAIDNGQVIGFISAVHYVHPDKPTELWINEVGVAPEHQGRGVGRQLMEAMLAHGRKQGCKSAWVLTDRSNTTAMCLYAGARGREAGTQTVMFEFDLQDL